MDTYFNYCLECPCVERPTSLWQTDLSDLFPSLKRKHWNKGKLNIKAWFFFYNANKSFKSIQKLYVSFLCIWCMFPLCFCNVCSVYGMMFILCSFSWQFISFDMNLGVLVAWNRCVPLGGYLFELAPSELWYAQST